MIWQCSDCGHQLVSARRPAACRFCGPDVQFYVASTREAAAGEGNRCSGHPGVCARPPAAPIVASPR
jgi:hypothetical protein